MGSASEPQPLSRALAELVAVRGLARSGGTGELASIWQETAGPAIAKQTRVLGLKRGVLQVAVSNAPLLGELVSFHRDALLRRLQSEYAHLEIRGLKFRLKGDMTARRD